MNIFEAEVKQDVVRVGVLEFPVSVVPDGSRYRHGVTVAAKRVGGIYGADKSDGV